MPGQEQQKKPVIVGETALKHGLSAEYIEEMWYDSSCEGFEVHRLPPRETNAITIRFLSCPDGILEMIAEDDLRCFYVFHAQVVPEGKMTTLIAEAFRLYGLFEA